MTSKVFGAPFSEELRRQLRLTLEKAPKLLNYPTKHVVIQKFTDFNQWYMKLIGLDKVKQLQARVTELEEKLVNTQNVRREIGKQLTEVREKSNQIQEQLYRIKRHEDAEKYMQLVMEENEIIKMEKEVSKVFQYYDTSERELFTAFTNAVRDSHEKQRTQLEYTKYFGLLLSIAGSFLTFCYSTVNKGDLKRFIDKRMIDYENSFRLTEENFKLKELLGVKNSQNIPKELTNDVWKYALIGLGLILITKYITS